MVSPRLWIGLAKGQLDHIVTWVGGTTTVEKDAVRVVTKESIVADIKEDLNRIHAQNLTSKKELH